MIRSLFSFKHLILLFLYILLCVVLLNLFFWFLPNEGSINPSLFPLVSIAVFILLAVGIVTCYYLLKRRVDLFHRVLESIVAEDWQMWESVSQRQRKSVFFEMIEKIVDVIREKNQTITRQQSERMALLSSMVEGVVAVDNQERILIVNKAAAELFDVEGEKAVGKMLSEVIRNAAVQKLLTRAFKEGGLVEGEIAVLAGQERKLLAHGALLRDADQQQIGVIAVFNDITRLEQYEKIRRDFVANVSHELKTPITAIKGFVETLLSSSTTDPTEVKRFLGIIAEQTDRMNAIVNDLLMLTSVEHEDENAEVEITSGSIKKVAIAAMASLEPKTNERKISMELNCPNDVLAEINLPLLEQALVNLLDNAINYSDPGKSVRVSITTDESQIKIAVIDQGIGIDKRFIPRLTERFFRVDKSRSRKQGGTGLGLAIVKHIVKAHHGELSIESELGVGSTFTIILPANPANPLSNLL